MIRYVCLSILIGIFFLFTRGVIAGTREFTTYYPSPKGDYERVVANKLSVGDSNADGVIDGQDQATRAGDIRLTPRDGDPSAWPAGETGELCFSSDNNALYHYDGSHWVL